MLHVLHVLEVLFENGFNWTTFGLWFCKLIFETCHNMSFKVFSKKLAQKDRIWCFKCWVSCLETNLEIPKFGSTLARTLCVHAVRSSGKSNARAWNVCIQYIACVYSLMLERGSSARRAWISCIQYFCSPLERGKSCSSGAPLSACPLEHRNPRSSETPIFWKFWKVC